MKAIYIPVTAPDDSLQVLEGATYKDIAEQVGIEYIELVHGKHSRDHRWVSVVDDEGHRKGMAPNFAGAQITGYPGYLMGPVLVFGEAWDNEDMGMTLVDINIDAFTLFLNKMSLRYTLMTPAAPDPA